MFRTKQSVDRHVQELFRNVKDDNERALRCYNIAKLYFNVEDYESARRYVSSYLEVKGDQPGAHKLLGNIYEALGQKEPALGQYKQSLELEPRQDELVLKVCEILADMDVGHDINRVKYWVDRADEKFPHHPTVFKLKEKLLTIDRPNNNGEDLEALIAAELSARPSDVQLRVKLLKYYIDKSRLDDAYKHAIEVESTHAHRDSVAWYEALCDLLSKCKDGRQPKWTFWILYVSSLERYAALSLKEQGHILKKTIPEAAQAVFNFDQALTEAKLQNFPNNAVFAEHMFTHMWGQLHYHLACLLLRKTKREQGSWSDTGRLCSPLLLTAIHVQPIDINASWVLNLKDQTKSQIQLWYREASYRCSQAGHVLQNYAREDVNRLIDKIDKFCVGSWRERIYQRIFVRRAHVATSYFCNHAANNPPLRLCSTTELKLYDQVAEDVWPASLHHHVWLGVVNKPRNNRTNSHDENGPYPHQYCHVFPALQLSIFNLSQAAPDSLGQLDIDAFLNAAVLCASVVVEEQQRSGFLSPDRLPTLPADITNTLCTCSQEKWWSSAYKMYRKQDGVSGDLGEIRQELQRGLEVVRCIGNHGLHPAILVHLARIFHHRAKMLKEKDKNHTDLPFLEARCELYWSAVVPLLERLLNNQAIRTTSSKMFDYQGKEMNNVELTNALEEGRLLLAQRYIRAKQHEQAIEALQALKCPEASFMQGEIYKSLADELMSTLPKESLTSAMRSQHIVMLSKARDCYYLTLDRLRSPGMNPKHPLNSELGSRIADIENDLKRIDPDVWRGDSNRHECDVMSEESYSSAHSGDPPIIQNSFTGGLSGTIPNLGTPQRIAHRTPKQASTPCRIQHQDILEFTRKTAQQEARPSPERLDAQIRQLIHSKDNMIHSIFEQNKALLQKIEELQKQFADFCKDSPQRQQQTQQQQQQQSRLNRTRSLSTGQNNHDEDLYVLGDDDYADLTYNSQQQTMPHQQQHIPANLFNQAQRNPYSPLVYPQAAAAAVTATFPGYYPPAMPFNDPHAQHMSSLYGGARVYQMPNYCYRPPTVDPNLGGLQKMSENIPGMFTSRLMNQLTDITPQQQQQQQQQQQHHQQQQQQQQLGVALQAPQISMQLQNLDTTRNELPAKDIAIQQTLPPMDQTINRAPPVNVVITTSDTLPTTVPTVQPTLSVTIPPQYRATSGQTINAATTTSTAPHNYQISMPSHAMIPTTVNLPPLSTTITNTISATVAEQERNTMKHGSVLSTSTHNYSSDGAEIEHDPLPDFVPVIPLPAEVKVTTGEEDETTLFSARAKLYRWSEKEWKERGIGHVKLLRNDEGKVRLVMRREQVLKICANHMLKRDMELTKMANNDRALIWVANDFADEEVKLEKLCIKFKYAEEAVAFKESFDRAKDSLPVSPIKPLVSRNIATNASSETTKITATSDNVKAPVIVGGFSFTSKPIIQETVEPEATRVGGKAEETAKPSPFAGFSFTSSTTTNNYVPGQQSGFTFVKSATGTPTQNISGAETATNLSDAGSRATLRRPHVPSSTKIVQSSNIVEKTGIEISGCINEDGEAVLYDKRATLMRCNADSTQWKNRGNGNVKILLEPRSGKLRIYIKRDETKKVFCNIELTETMKFTIPADRPNVVTWNARENFAVLYETSILAEQSVNFIGALQLRMKNDRLPMSDIKIDGKMVRVVDSTSGIKEKTNEKPSLAEMFKPATGSWECSSCYTRNDSSNSKCLACETERPGVTLKSSTSETPTTMQNDKSTLWSQFKPQPESWECQSCYIRNSKDNSYCVACDTAKDPSMPPKQKTSAIEVADNSSSKEKSSSTGGFTFGIPTSSAITTKNSLADTFKPVPGSWECQTCLVRNSAASNHCSACETPKDPSIPAKTKLTASFSLGNVSSSTPSFSFGIPQTASKDTATGGFTFKMQTTNDKAAGDSAKNSTNIPIFGGVVSSTITGNSVNQTSGNFVFGIPQRPSTPPNTHEIGEFTFGSPGKSFDFQFSTKSSIKSPIGVTASGKTGAAAGDASEDEVAESDDVYFAPVIPLPDKIEVKTGEEDEEILYTHRAKLFRYDGVAKEWKERGLGDIKLLRHRETKKLRMVMRRDQTLKLCLNHVVNGDLEFKPKDEKTWLWNAADYSEGDIECLQLACRFKTSDIANDFKRTVDAALENAKKLSQPGDTTKVTVQEKVVEETRVDEKNSPTPDDLQVVYEMKVTDEEKAAALKLQLPENFYAYKQKEDCPGCYGCREPEIPIFDDVKSRDHADDSTKNETTNKTIFSPINVKIAPPKFKSPICQKSNVDTSSTTATTTATASLFGGGEIIQKPAIPFVPGTTDDSSKSTDKKITNFVFGPSLIGNNQSTSKNLTDIVNPENLSICSPSKVSDQQNTFGRIQSPFGGGTTTTTATAAIPIFGNVGQTSIFSGTPNTGTSIFGGTATAKGSVETVKESGGSTTSSSFQNIFGGGTTKSSLTTTETTTANPIFGQPGWYGTTASNVPSSMVGNTLFGSGDGKNGATHTFGASSLNAQFSFDNITGTDGTNVSTDDVTSKDTKNSSNDKITKDIENNENISFLSLGDGSTFSTLAAQCPQQPSFKKDPNFLFAGAGASVFGKSTSSYSGAKNAGIVGNKNISNSTTSGVATSNETTAAGEEEENDEKNNDDGGQEYDPHFEPIIPLPDAIEVRTGEEEEDRIFCERAKLYRYESETKEWKERGTGQMKLLHHKVHGTYRLLLRREQVFKVVCNQLVTSELELRPLHSSDRAWMWASINHAEEPYALEELAVKFKNPELAIQFKDAVEKAQQELRERQDSGPTGGNNESDSTECYGDEQEDDEEDSIIFITLTDLHVLQNGVWKLIGDGILKILYDSEIYGAKIMIESEYTSEILSNTVISMETSFEMIENACVWTAIDHVLNPPMRRTLKAVFSSLQLAQDMYTNCLHGQEYAKQADISETGYYDPSIE